MGKCRSVWLGVAAGVILIVGCGGSESGTAEKALYGWVSVPGGPDRRMAYRFVGDLAIAAGGIIVGTRQNPPPVDAPARNTGMITTHSELLWPDRTIPFTIAEAVDGHQRGTLAHAMSEWAQRAGFKFVPLELGQESSWPMDYVAFVPGAHCASPIGRRTGRQEASVGGCNSTGDFMRLVGLQIGMYPEHLRPDRDSHIEINWGNLDESEKYLFEIPTLAEGEYLAPTHYDFESVMHISAEHYPHMYVDGGAYEIRNDDGRYSFGDLRSLGQQASKLSPGDLTTVARVYGPAPSDYDPLPVLQGDVWADPYRPGQAIQIKRQGNRLLGTIYLHDRYGEPVWAVFNQDFPNGPRRRFTVQLDRLTGPALGTSRDSWGEAASVPGTVTTVPFGELTVLAHSSGSLSLHYLGSGGNHWVTMVPFDQASAASPYTRLWWDSATPGQGVQVRRAGDFVQGVWYLYDESGQGTWYTFWGNVAGNQFEGELKKAIGPSLMTDTLDVDFTPVGDITLTFTDSSSMTMTYDLRGKSQTLYLTPF